MPNKTRPGLNRTGVRMTPVEAGAMADLIALYPPSESTKSMAFVRSEAIAEAEAVGSVPASAFFGKDMATASRSSRGVRPAMLIDKLGERLAFERMGTRLYEALLTKCLQLLSSDDPLLLDLERIHDQEAEHFQMLFEAIESLGADPTAVTPGADVGAVLARGILQVVTDPRTDLPQSLNAMLLAELADHASWELLLKLTRDAGHHDLLDGFARALREEAEHLHIIKQWLERTVMAEEA